MWLSDWLRALHRQTGSGKTHTMFGDTTADPRLGSSRLGIVPRVCEELVGALEARRALGLEAKLRVSYVRMMWSSNTRLAAVTTSLSLPPCHCLPVTASLAAHPLLNGSPPA